jgi:hypothetical protein
MAKPPDKEEAIESAVEESQSARVDASAFAEVVGEWRSRALAAEIGHFTVAKQMRRRVLLLSLAPATLAVLAGLFLVMEGALSIWLHEPLEFGPIFELAMAGFALGAGVLAFLQGTLSFASRAERHVVAANRYQDLVRDMSLQLERAQDALQEALHQWLDQDRTQMNRIGTESPEIGERVWNDVLLEFPVQT